MTYPMALAKWQPSPESPSDSVMGYYNQIISHTGYFAVCGAKGCIRSCMDSLEKRKNIGQCEFRTKVSPRPAWKLERPELDRTGGIAEGKFPEMYNNPDTNPGAWK